jgi:hypothetical protein
VSTPEENNKNKGVLQWDVKEDIQLRGCHEEGQGEIGYISRNFRLNL